MQQEEAKNIEHLAWAIKSRRRIQSATLQLYELMLSQSATTEQRKQMLELAAVAFSLWRAAFLADRKAGTEARTVHAREFVLKMLTDNSIAFAQDRAGRNWTFSYYIDNAYHRLEKLKMSSFPGIGPLVPSTRKVPRTARRRWDCLQDGLEVALAVLQKQLKVSSLAPR